MGLLAVAVPVIVHLLNKRTAKVVEWGAMRFLLDTLMRRRRRILLEEMLLLACRCLLVALLVLALARPFIPEGSRVPWPIVLPLVLLAITLFAVNFALWRYPKWRRRVVALALLAALLGAGAILAERWLNLRRFGADPARDVALIIDGSTSMTMDVAGRTNFDRALEEARRLIEHAPRGTAFSLVLGGPTPIVATPAPVSDRAQLYRHLDGLRPALGTMQTLDAVGAALMTLAEGHRSARQIVVISDGQRHGWGMDRLEDWRLAGAAFQRFPSPPQLLLRRLELPTSIRNVAVVDLSLSRAVVGVDRDVRIHVAVHNTGTESVTPQALHLRVGDERLSDFSLGQIDPGAERRVSFLHRFHAPGAHVIEAALEVDDEMAADNTMRRAMQVVERVPVLVVDGSSARRFAQRAGGYVTAALAPEQRQVPAEPPAGMDRPEHLLAPEWIEASALPARDSFDAYALVVLADVRSLPSSTRDRLADYVRAGGSLMALHGTRSDSEFYNSWQAGAETFLPFPLQTLEAPGEGESLGFDLATFEHTALQGLRDDTDMARTVLGPYWRFGEAETSAGRVGARLSNGLPWLGEVRRGRGRALQIATALDGSAGNLVAQRSFVPLVHALTYHLTRSVAAPLDLDPARTHTLRLPLAEAKPEDEEGVAGFWTAGLPAEVQGPDDARFAAEFFSAGDGLALRIERRLSPGLYEVSVPEALSALLTPVMHPERHTLPFTIRADQRASLLQPLTGRDIDRIRPYLDFMVADNSEDAVRVLTGQAFGRELWRILAVAAVLLVVAETALTRWIAIQRRVGEKDPVEFDAKPSLASMGSGQRQ